MAKGRTSSALSKLAQLQAKTAVLLERVTEASDSVTEPASRVIERTIPTELVQLGDELKVVRGGSVPADGYLLSGNALVQCVSIVIVGVVDILLCRSTSRC